MTLELPQTGRQNVLNAMLTGFNITALKVHVLKARVPQTDNTVLATLAANEANWMGYAPQLVGPFTPPTLPLINQPSVTTSSVTFPNTGAAGTGLIYGYYVTDLTDTLLFGYEDFGGVTYTAPFPEPYSISINFQLNTIL